MSYSDGLASAAPGGDADGHGHSLPDCLPVFRTNAYNVADFLVCLRCQRFYHPQFFGPCCQADHRVPRNLLFLSEEASNGQEGGMKE